MTQFLEYLLKTGACLALFYPFYKYLLAKETFFGLNRAILIGSIAASFLLPVWTLTILKEAAPVQIIPYTNEVSFAGGTYQSGDALPAMDLKDIFLLAVTAIYIAGVLVCFAKYVAGLFRIVQIIRGSQKQESCEGILYLSPERIIPFNWFGYIVISQKDYEENGQIILEHERAHIIYRHDFDLILINLLTIIQWFNPFIRLLKNEIVTLHEFQADNRVINKGIDAKKYQYLLIALGTSQSYSIPVVNNLCSGNFKKRIKMMLKKQSTPFRAVKAMLLIPMLAGAVTLFAKTEYVTVPVVSKENIGNSIDKMTRIQAVKAVEAIYQKTRNNSLALKSILNYTKRATGNFESMVYLAQMTYEFRYHTTAFVKIARYASKARVETDYFRQLADISVMKLEETLKIIAVAEEVSKLNTATSPEIDKKIELFKKSAKYKTLDEARNYNRNLGQPAKILPPAETNPKITQPNSKQKDVKINRNQVITITITKEGTYEFVSTKNKVLSHSSANIDTFDQVLKTVISSSRYPKDSLYFSLIIDQGEFSKEHSDVLEAITDRLKSNGINLKQISARRFINLNSTFSDALQSEILKHFFQNIRYPEQSKEIGDTGKFYVKLKIKNGEVFSSTIISAFEKVGVPMLQDIVVVGYKNKNSASAQSTPNTDHKAIADELVRVAKTLSGLENPEWKNLTAEFAIPVNFTLR